MTRIAERLSEYLFTIVEWECSACKNRIVTKVNDVAPSFCAKCGAQFALPSSGMRRGSSSSKARE